MTVIPLWSIKKKSKIKCVHFTSFENNIIVHDWKIILNKIYLFINMLTWINFIDSLILLKNNILIFVSSFYFLIIIFICLD
jgi:hypothetical protein